LEVVDGGKGAPDIARQRTQGEPEGFNGAFQALEQVGGHQRLQAAFAVSLSQLASATLNLGVVDIFVLAHAAGQDVADGRVDGELQDRELGEDLVEVDNVGPRGDCAVERQRLAALREGTDVRGVVERLDVLARAGDGDRIEQLEEVEVECLEDRGR